MLNIVADENISYAEEAFSRFGKVTLCHGRKITKDLLKDTDALVVRSITKVNKDLLEGTPVKFVGTATIGTDHIDKSYLKEKSIAFSDAAGCNADAVAEYVFTALLKTAVEKNFKLEGKTIGIVGVGNIGSRIARLAPLLGMKVLKNDPPLHRKTGSDEYVPFENIFDADIVTLHVPLNMDGIDKTYHMFDADNLERLKDGTILINACRGQVVDNPALLKIIEKKNLTVILDVWENEPDINTDLLNKVFIGSPHIAGYSLEGKVNGTSFIYDALSKFLGKEDGWKPALPEVEDNFISLNLSEEKEHLLYNLFNKIYPIKRDDNNLRELINMKADERPVSFDKLRKNYPLRRELNNYAVDISDIDNDLRNVLTGFRLKNVPKG